MYAVAMQYSARLIISQYRFTMVYSESPDMSDSSHDFAQPQTARGQLPPPSHRRVDEARMTLNRNGNNHLGKEQYGSPVLMHPPQWSAQDGSHTDHYIHMPPVAPAGLVVRHRTDFHRARFQPYPKLPTNPPLRDTR